MKKPKNRISDEERKLFQANMKTVRPLIHDKIVSGSPTKPKISPTYSPEPSISPPQMEVNTVLEPLRSEEPMYFMRPGVQIRVMRKLQRGDFSMDAELDLHGLNIQQAYSALNEFITFCIYEELQCIKIIHGKGSGSKEPHPILKNKVNLWLRQYRNVLAFCSAKPRDGSTGAVYVLLKLGI